MHNTIDSKRRLLLLGSTLGLLSLPVWGATRLLTPRQTPGPFYPDLPLLDKDNDLTRVGDNTGVAAGRLTDLTGQVLDENGRPLRDVRVEIWQCDANGRYHHSRDNRNIPMDPDFQGFGQTITDAHGRYRFRTIRPVPYPGRTPHIHAAVYRPDTRPFVTQIYIAGEPRNTDDFLFRQIPVELRPLVVADFRPSRVDDTLLAAGFDFILADRLQS